MKATLEFNLEEVEQRAELRRCTNATNAYIAIHTIQEFLRNKIKYTEDESINLEDMQKQVYLILETYKIDQDDLT